MSRLSHREGNSEVTSCYERNPLRVDLLSIELPWHNMLTTEIQSPAFRSSQISSPISEVLQEERIPAKAQVHIDVRFLRN